MRHCRLCGSERPILLLDMGEHPVARRVLSSPTEKENVHQLSLHFCEYCGLIQIVDPIPPEQLYSSNTRLDGNYSWLSSWKYVPHAARLSQLIQNLPRLSKISKITEVGSNDGSFLEVLKSIGYQNLLGIEPSEGACEAALIRKIDTLQGFFNLETAQRVKTDHKECDLLIVRHVLEHVGRLEEFRAAMTALLSPGSYVMFEVPDTESMLTTMDYSSVWEEHVNYFTLETLQRFLADSGIEVFHHESAVLGGEVIILLGKYVGDPASKLESGYLDRLQDMAYAFRDRWPDFRREFTQYLEDSRNHGDSIAVYGAGNRASSFLNLTGVSPHIECVLDDRLEKLGKYMPGSHLQILSGETLDTGSIDLCLLAVSAENEEKVIANHQAFLDRGGRFVSILPPSPRLLNMWPQVAEPEPGATESLKMNASARRVSS